MKLSNEINKAMTNKEKLRKEVEQWVKDHPNSGLFGDIPNRSCWNCNKAHEYLKKADYPIQCFECGNIFYKGIQLTFYK